MSSNSIGTVFRIFFIFISMLLFWFAIVAIFYSLAFLLFGFEFSFKTLGILFLLLIFFRVFYPKFAFK